ncbi:hypothetical protein FQZ97_1114850 [compost metagenome]
MEAATAVRQRGIEQQSPRPRTNIVEVMGGHHHIEVGPVGVLAQGLTNHLAQIAAVGQFDLPRVDALLIAPWRPAVDHGQAFELLHGLTLALWRD